MKTLILGIGNPMVTDDEAGIENSLKTKEEKNGLSRRSHLG